MSPFLPIGILLALFVGTGTLVWGWPEGYSLMALLPAVIIGTTLGHIVNAKRGLVQLRPGAIAIAVFLGTVSIIVTGGFFKASNTPAEKTIEASMSTLIPAGDVMAYVENPINLSRWNGFYQDVERVGAADGSPGSSYNVTLKFENQVVPARMVVEEPASKSSFRWTIDFGDGARIQDFTETVTVEAHKKSTTIRHQTRYRVDSVLVRMLNNFVVGDMFETYSQESLGHLVKELSE